MAAKLLALLGALCLVGLTAADPCKGVPNDVGVAVGKCSPLFYDCENGQIFGTQSCCGNQPTCSLVFNPKVNGCASVGAVGTRGCDCAGAYAGNPDLISACNVCQKKKKAGVFPIVPPPAVSNKFVECSVAGVYVQTCNPGQVYCKKTHRCEQECPPKAKRVMF